MTISGILSEDIQKLARAYQPEFAELIAFGGSPEISETGGGIYAIEDIGGQAFSVKGVADGAALYVLATNGDDGLLFPTDPDYGTARWLVGIYEVESGDQVAQADAETVEDAYSQAFVNMRAGVLA